MRDINIYTRREREKKDRRQTERLIEEGREANSPPKKKGWSKRLTERKANGRTKGGERDRQADKHTKRGM